jgi:hypothetical protein
VRRSRGARSDQVENLSVLGETTEGFLREHEVTIHTDLEHASVGGFESAFDPQRLVELGSQTGGPGLVVSLAAILDLDPHASPPPLRVSS